MNCCWFHEYFEDWRTINIFLRNIITCISRQKWLVRITLNVFLASWHIASHFMIDNIRLLNFFCRIWCLTYKSTITLTGDSPLIIGNRKYSLVAGIILFVLFAPIEVYRTVLTKNGMPLVAKDQSVAMLQSGAASICSAWHISPLTCMCKKSALQLSLNEILSRWMWCNIDDILNLNSLSPQLSSYFLPISTQICSLYHIIGPLLALTIIFLEKFQFFQLILHFISVLKLTRCNVT